MPGTKLPAASPAKRDAKPQRPAADPKLVGGVELDDHVFANHPKHGPMAVRVHRKGADGFIGEAEGGERHGFFWDAYLGHKARRLAQMEVVDRGADGALLRDERGRVRYLAGDIPVQEESDFGDDEQELEGLAKALMALPVLRIPDAPLMLKAMPADRAGLTLRDTTDKTGKRTKRWMRSGPDAHADPSERAPMKHGDTVRFRHGDVEGHGKIVGSGRDGVLLEGEDGRQHQVRHEHLIGPHGATGAGGGEEGAAPAPPGDASGGASPDGKTAAAGAGGGDDDGDGTIPPDKFDAAAYLKEHMKEVTPEQVLAGFPPEVAKEIAETNAKLKGLPQTIDTFKKDGKWTPERAAIHRRIIDEFFTPDRVSAATPADGSPPSFIILGGRGGSGKSWFSGKVYDPAKSVVLDADEIKKRLPEYKGWNAAQVHEESSEIFDAITDKAKNSGLNIVHDATMKTAAKAVRLVNEFKADGYRVEAHYMFLPPQEAAKRAVERFMGKTKRFVPPGVVLGNTTNEASFDQVKNLVDRWSFHDNQGSKDDGPKLISQDGSDGTDGRKSGLPGLPAAESEHRDQGVRGDGKAVGRSRGGPLGKAQADPGSGRVGRLAGLGRRLLVFFSGG